MDTSKKSTLKSFRVNLLFFDYFNVKVWQQYFFSTCTSLKYYSFTLCTLPMAGALLVTEFLDSDNQSREINMLNTTLSLR